MIKKLTKEQEKAIPSYYNKWESLGKRTETVNRESVEEAIKYFYSLIGKKCPKVVILSSPMACQLACNVLAGDSRQLNNQLNNQLASQLDSQLYSQLDSQLASQLDSQLDSQLNNHLYSQLDSQLSSQLYSQLDSQLNNHLYSQLRNQLDSQLQTSKKKHYQRSYQTIINYCGYYCFYDFILNELFPSKRKDFKEFNNVINNIKELHYYIMFDDVVFVSDFPEALHFNDNMLHNSEGPAVLYRDGYSLFASEGKPWNEEQVKRYEHNREFSSGVQEIING